MDTRNAFFRRSAVQWGALIVSAGVLLLGWALSSSPIRNHFFLWLMNIDYLGPVGGINDEHLWGYAGIYPYAINSLLTAAFGAPLLIWIGAVATAGHLLAPLEGCLTQSRAAAAPEEGGARAGLSLRAERPAAVGLGTGAFVGLVAVAAAGAVGTWQWAQRPGSLLYRFPVQPLYSVLWSWYGAILVALIAGAWVGILLAALYRRTEPGAVSERETAGGQV